MIVLPAIDLRGGQCVRLLQGEPERETIYCEDPASLAQRWQAAGAESGHVWTGLRHLHRLPHILPMMLGTE